MTNLVAAYQANDILGFEKILRTNRRGAGFRVIYRVWAAPCGLEGHGNVSATPNRRGAPLSWPVHLL